LILGGARIILKQRKKASAKPGSLAS